MTSYRKIFHFNPTCEIAIANGSAYYQAPALLRNFEEELAPLLLFFAKAEDHVLKEQKVTGAFEESMRYYGFSDAKILTKNESLNRVQKELVSPTPWGWSPAAKNYLSAFEQPAELQQQTDQVIKHDLFQRKHAVKFLTNFMVSRCSESIFPGNEQLPVLLYTPGEVDAYLNQHKQIVLKSPLSSSGRGLQVIRKSKLNDSNRKWVQTNLSQRGYLVAEPLYDKQSDLSFQFEITTSGQLIYHGVSYFTTNANGQYQGHLLNPKPGPSDVYFNMNFLHELAQELQLQLKGSVFQNYYRGFLGIDALVYHENKQLKIQPCLEINPRLNMGILSKIIEKKIHRESQGMFRVYYHPQKNYAEFIAKMTRKYPPLMADRKFRKGFISLTSPSLDSKFGAYLLLD